MKSMRNTLDIVFIGTIALTVYLLQQSGTRHELDSRREKAAHDTLQAMFSADTAVVHVDSDGVVLSWNPAAQKLAGWVQSDLVGDRLEKVMPLDKRDAHRAKFLKISKSFPDRNVHAACELLSKFKNNDGSERRVAVDVEIIDLGGSYVALMRPKTAVVMASRQVDEKSSGQVK